VFLLCQLAPIVSKLLQLYFFIMLAYALVSWVPGLRGRWSDYVAMLVEPVLAPVRQIIPPLGGFDLAFLVVIIAVRWSSTAVDSFGCYS
jgi:YggT family protein